MAGVNILHVPYKGAPQAVTDVLAGHMSMMFNSIAPVLPHVKSGRVRTLGIASAKRSPQLPDIPTIAESGVPGYESENWFGLFAPAKTPQRLITLLNHALVKVVRSPEVRAQFEALGADPVGSTPGELAAFMRRDSERYRQVIRISGAKID
jgi:tripartite-type tricarboxylate transporter receptor subunit TctC